MLLKSSKINQNYAEHQKYFEDETIGIKKIKKSFLPAKKRH